MVINFKFFIVVKLISKMWRWDLSLFLRAINTFFSISYVLVVIISFIRLTGFRLVLLLIKFSPHVSCRMNFKMISFRFIFSNHLYLVLSFLSFHLVSYVSTIIGYFITWITNFRIIWVWLWIIRLKVWFYIFLSLF